MNKKSIALISTLLMLFAACVGEVGPQGEAGAQGEEEAEVGGTLVVYSGRKESLVADLIASFVAETGVTVEVRYAKSAALAGTLALEGAISPADVFLSQDPVSLGVVAKEGLFDVLPEDILIS